MVRGEDLMAPLPKNVCIETVRLRELLNEGKHRRAEVKARVLEILATGTARPPMQKLAAELFGARRGRQATGLYKWIEIGEDAYWLSVDGVPRKDILRDLAKKYGRGEKHIDACMTQYEKARSEEQ